MIVIEYILLGLAATLAVLTILLGLSVLSLAAFWKSWREDNDADWN
jgi:hypothetical protein